MNPLLTLVAIVCATTHPSSDDDRPRYEFLGPRWVVFEPEATDEDMRLLEAHPGLRTIVIASARVSDAGIARTVNCPDLSSLSTLGGGITDGGLEPLRHLSHLRTFAIQQTAIGGVALDYLPSALTELVLEDGPNVAGNTIPRIARLRQLRRLSIVNCAIGDVGMDRISELAELRDLTLCGTGLSDVSLPFIARLKHLNRLSLERSRVTDSGIAALKAAPGLAELDLSGSTVNGSGLAPLSVLTGLTTLHLDSSMVDDAGALELARLGSVVYLSLNNCKITDAGLARLAAMARLARIDLAGCSITDAGFKSITRCRSLRRIDATGTRVTDRAVQAAIDSGVRAWNHGSGDTRPARFYDR